jgi:hypothetical protein
MLLTSLPHWRTQRTQTRRSVPARARPRLENLEDRCLLTTVTNLFDSGAGSLRDAIMAGGTIDFQPGLTGTIALSSTLEIGQDVNIIGPGAGLLTISGQQSVQVMTIDNNVNATMSGLTIADGKGIEGGGIFVSQSAVVNLTNSVVTDNVVTGAGYGGGIDNTGTLFLWGCTIAGNKATDAAGSAGGISSNNLLMATNCTIANNSGPAYAGGVWIANDATFTNCTISGNQSVGGFNSAGGGIVIENLASPVTLINTIVAKNTAKTGPDILGHVAKADHCIVGDGAGNNVVNGVNGNQVLVDPMLQPLGDYGGPTPTMAIALPSPAIDAGTPFGAPWVDQRGYARPARTGFDVGAYEFQALAPDQAIIAVGADAGGLPEVKVYDAKTAQLKFQFLAFDPSFTGGVRVAVGDVHGDGVPDIIVGSGPGGPPLVKVIDGAKLNQVQANGEIADSALLGDFDAYDPAFRGGVNVALGNVDSDYDRDVITAAGAGGGPHVKVIDSALLGLTQANGEIADGALLASFYAYAPTFTGGVNIAASDVNGDGVDDIVTGAGPGGGPHVEVIDGTKLGQMHSNGQIGDAALLASFYAYDPAFLGGVYVAAGDLNGESHADLITGPGAGGGPHVKVIDGTKLGQLQPNAEILDSALLYSFMAYDPTFLGGVRVSAGIADGAAPPDILTGAGPGGGPHVRAFDCPSLAVLDSFFAYSPSFTGGVFVGASS